MSTAEVAEYLGVSVPTVTRLVKRGVLASRPVSPALQRPKAFEFDRSVVEAYKAKIATAAKK